MGIESSPPDVEESTEPPICPYSKEHYPGKDTPPIDVEGKDSLEIGQTGLIPTEPSCGAKELHAEDSRLHLSLQDPSQDAHVIDLDALAAALNVDINNGLLSEEAEARLLRDGPNRFREMEGVSAWKILLRQVSNSLTLVLVITMAVSFGIDDYIEGGVIAAVILLNIVVGFVQDYRAEKTILSLHRLSAPLCNVLRNGRVVSIKAESLVVGDIVKLTVGDIVPADIRLLDGMNVFTDEALLTGESLPVMKTPQATLTSRDIPIGDRTNMAYSGSNITQGRAEGVVIATGMATEMGKIAQLLQDKDPNENLGLLARTVGNLKNTGKNLLGLVGTPLQVKLSKFALLLFALAIILAIIVFSVSEWDVQGEVLIYGICVAVAVVPESLIAVLTITIAVGTKAMARGNVIVRKLQCLEAVGGVTNICSDKTGTLTQGKMIARSAWIPGAGTLTVDQTTDPVDPTSGVVQMDEIDWEPETVQGNHALNTFLTAISLCNLSIVHSGVCSVSETEITGATESTWTAVGEPTEIALHVLAMRFGFGKPDVLRTRDVLLHTEYPFDSSIKKMTVVYTNPKARTLEVYTKGAPEAVISSFNISEKEKTLIQETADRMAGEGLRVLCIGYKMAPIDDKSQVCPRNAAESNLTFGGLVGLYDPPRVETAAAVRRCQMAGITVHMLTGDHIRTATAIASEVGILDAIINAKSSRLVMAAKDFDRLSDEEIDSIEQLPLVIARCSPTTKVRMVDAMHRRKAFCVMTGDGVNDSPALKRADVGIAMGKNGSDVAKEAADMVLTDDNFSSIVKAVEEGRRLFDNIQKFLMHLLISNIAQVILLLIALAFKDNHGNSVFPLSPLEILWANLITSSFLALGLGLEEAQPDIMYRPPHDLKVGVFTRELITDKMIYGTFMGTLCLVAYVCVIYGAGSGSASMGINCNEGYNETCDTVFRARATTYATLTYLLLVTAWEVKHFSRSLFNLDPSMPPGPLTVFTAIWRNRFLFWAVVAGFVIAFPVIYLPFVNRIVFKHQSIYWEWGIVFGCVLVYLVLIEIWKAIKRRFRIGSGRHGTLTMEDAEMRAGLGSPTSLSMSANASVDASVEMK
ncbi:calcium-transporting ATPase 3 [Aspergillus campestris IBT 28561]|uniref:P-type Na(+) transporter n=1 Tax=Aspergillus campestris (strain IBT 28561) TaxID=1392248 RepID=A0A2I1D5F3_ASPC2|nr:calcium-transporting ATPase 3 [Aspergillus campestris IBT 28561]PKY05107.1 calcium-transporting ATPase 3 [Aspergillus campestris IBT 28561]